MASEMSPVVYACDSNFHDADSVNVLNKITAGAGFEGTSEDRKLERTV